MTQVMTIQHVIDAILSAVPGAPLPDTVDTVKSGDPAQPVRGIVTTFMATRQVIDKTIELGANLIITHEPTYFNHRDDKAWLQGDPVIESKREVLQRNGIVVWRFHDHWHMHRPDGIATGFLQALGWGEYVDPQVDYVANIKAMPLSALVSLLKTKLGMNTVRVVGPADMTCQRVAMLLGSCPPEWQIAAFRETNADVVICGETCEWQVCEYVRDSAAAGRERALIILGHEKSEEDGMGYLVEWLRPKAPGVSITHVPAGDPIRFI
jgi:putative NIF3 family GTP cyclohydrolase 1 type 2